jgi:hypothetical protein
LLKAGIEPTTLGFSVQCSTTELFKRFSYYIDQIFHSEFFLFAILRSGNSYY